MCPPTLSQAHPVVKSWLRHCRGTELNPAIAHSALWIGDFKLGNKDAALLRWAPYADNYCKGQLYPEYCSQNMMAGQTVA